MHLIDVVDRLGLALGSQHGGTERLDQPGDLLTDSAQPDHKHGLLVHLLHWPPARPLAGCLLSLQAGQILGARQYPEQSKLGQCAAVHARRRGEQHPS
jgi:hypothetical protein